MLKRRLDRRRKNNNNTSNNGGPALVGTEAKAIENIKRNQKNFKYPDDGFVTPIEQSLLYSMILAGPTVYPEDVVSQHIEEEDFTVYLPVADKERQHHRHEEEARASYAQLGAIVGLSVEKFPPPKDEEFSTSSITSTDHEKQSIAQKLCKSVLQCVIQYAKEHDLDRQAEVEELSEILNNHINKRSKKAEMRNMLPFLLGYTFTILTANPWPMLVGATMTTSGPGNEKIENERKNVVSIAKETNRMADVETTGLLDE